MSHYSIPGFRREETAAKTSAVRMSLGNPPTTAIQQALGPTISIESYHRSVQLYHTTRRALRDPEEFIRETTQESLSDDEREFMVELVRLEPTLFFDKIMERFYDCNGVVPMDDMYSLQELLVQELCVTLDKTRPANNRKSLEKKYQYIARITKHPANFLVFVDETAIRFPDRRTLYGTRQASMASNESQTRIKKGPFSLILAISKSGFLELTVNEHQTQPRDFEKFLTTHLLPHMSRYPERNSILMMDQASVHRGPRVEKLCRRAGVLINYLPANCPELNPTGPFFSIIKRSLRRSRVLLNASDPGLEIYQTALQLLSPELCREFYKQAGYNGPRWFADDGPDDT
ncbi:hypothetical protein PGT21_050229 [Puccinia graminis f. sp. tritici]|uniref:Tc1-like transposase DDE domain-containing protein n=1 Tax=Puccinia graminis f. sp. tritici TaxID=56615 RepID=A0A5B0SKW0_PUCGR|nr:hypothetical protein PGT21_050229 [Puccinia graminis f. sp. tritici]KAA1138542.1 hypothetical protein PGTUg99_050183 [Puccinia graminis f. sp. tritici]